MNFDGWKNFKIKKYLVDNNIKSNSCEICNLPPIWNGKILTLQLDHIDGDRYNNDLSNLRIICPNCHTQTDTYCSKNSTRSFVNYRSISEMDLIEFFSKNSKLYLTDFCRYKNLNYGNAACRNYILKILGNTDSPYLIPVRDKYLELNYKKAFSKYKSKDDYFETVKKNNDKKYAILCEELVKSDIDFSKFGWVGKAADIIGIEPQYVKRWMIRFLPEFYERKCYKRKISIKN